MRLITVGSIVLSLIGIVGCAETPAPPAAEASASGTSDAEAFVGNWRLAGIERRDAEDQPLPLNPGALGEGATGFIMYDAGGYMGVVIQAADRGRYAGEGRTPEEALEDLRSYVSYFGRYTVDDEEGVVTHHLVGSLFPGGAGSDYRRAYELTGDRLILQPPPNDAGEVTRLTWERVPELVDPSAEQRRFFGFWRLGGIERRFADGEVVPAEGGFEDGFIIYMPSGHMAVHLQRGDRPTWGEDGPAPADADATMRSYASYFGPFTVHEDEGYVVHHRVGSTSRTSIDTDAQRFYELSEDTLVLKPPPAEVEGRQVQTALTWNRLR